MFLFSCLSPVRSLPIGNKRFPTVWEDDPAGTHDVSCVHVSDHYNHYIEPKQTERWPSCHCPVKTCVEGEVLIKKRYRFYRVKYKRATNLRSCRRYQRTCIAHIDLYVFFFFVFALIRLASRTFFLRLPDHICWIRPLSYHSWSYFHPFPVSVRPVYNFPTSEFTNLFNYHSALDVRPNCFDQFSLIFLTTLVIPNFPFHTFISDSIQPSHFAYPPSHCRLFAFRFGILFLV